MTMQEVSFEEDRLSIFDRRATQYHPILWPPWGWREQARTVSVAMRVNNIAELGREIVRTLADEFLERNRGRFGVIGVRSRQVLWVANSMPEVAKSLQNQPPNEPYYIVRFGYSSIGTIK